MIIETKLYVPETRGALVPRPHLYERLDKGLNSKVTLLTAPAGYGKSTLLSEWTRMIKVQVAWVSLDSNDNSPARFWMHTIESLKRISPSFAEQTTLHYSGEDQDPTGHALVAMLINRLNRLQEKIVLIWDDFQIVNNESILNGVTYFLEHMPTSIHIYLASRVQPKLTLSRLRIDGSLNELRMDDLRFGMEEADAFFRECTELLLDTDELMTIQAKTEGWIAGMRVVALSFGYDKDQGDLIKQVSNMTGRHRNIADYFFEEVFMKQSTEMQQFLMETAILERMNASLAEAITNLPNGTRMLFQLEQENLFLVSLDHERQWYRYHHLFQEFLRMRIRPEQVKALHKKAGYWFVENDLPHVAIAHYIQGEHFEEALHLLEPLASKMMRFDWDTLLNWLQIIPDRLLFQKQDLLLMNMASLLLSGQTELANEKWDWALRTLEENRSRLSVEVVDSYESGLGMLQIISSYFNADFTETVRLTEKFLEKHPKGGAQIHLGIDGDGYHPRWDFAMTMGGPKKAEKILDRLFELWSKTENAFFIADVCLAYGILMYEWNRLGEAKAYLKQAYHLRLKHGNAGFYVLAGSLLAKTYTALGDVHQSAQIMDRLKLEINPSTYPNLSKKVEFFQAQLSFGQGKTEQAVAWLKRVDIQPTDDIPSFVTEEYELLAHLLVLLGDHKAGHDLTKRLLHKAQQENRKPLEIEMLLLHSLLLNEAGEITESFLVLEQALKVAEQDGYIRTFIDKGHQMLELLNQYVKYRQNNHYTSSGNVLLSYVKQLLNMMTLDLMKTGNHSKVAIDDQLLTNKEILVLKLIQAGCSNKEIADELEISLSTVKTHINNLYRKLGVNNRVLAIQRAQELKIL